MDLGRKSMLRLTEFWQGLHRKMHHKGASPKPEDSPKRFRNDGGFEPRVVQPAISDTLDGFGTRRHLRLVAYVRSGHDSRAVDQEQEIRAFCQKHGYTVEAVFGKTGNHVAELDAALDAMQDADGLIIIDAMRLFCHEHDPVRALKDQINNLFFHRNKRLLTIHDAIDTGTTAGQAQLMHFVNELYDQSRRPTEGLYNIEASRFEIADHALQSEE